MGRRPAKFWAGWARPRFGRTNIAAIDPGVWRGHPGCTPNDGWREFPTFPTVITVIYQL
uniref:Uncharacterized protein n=1 Tax=Oryza sativa subsp. japonica TaxID=39947 RepID=Q67VQ8_ORYSJ|nr:hypothetical protein [Oryza sativa Japonica Group]BAD37761.1 hypothetical protein [Oryza sativa Japonica Group]